MKKLISLIVVFSIFAAMVVSAIKAKADHFCEPDYIWYMDETTGHIIIDAPEVNIAGYAVLESTNGDIWYISHMVEYDNSMPGCFKGLEIIANQAVDVLNGLPGKDNYLTWAFNTWLLQLRVNFMVPFIDQEDNEVIELYFTMLVQEQCDYLNDWLTHIANDNARNKTLEVGKSFCGIRTTYLPMVIN